MFVSTLLILTLGATPATRPATTRPTTTQPNPGAQGELDLLRRCVAEGETAVARLKTRLAKTSPTLTWTGREDYRAIDLLKDEIAYIQADLNTLKSAIRAIQSHDPRGTKHPLLTRRPANLDRSFFLRKTAGDAFPEHWPPADLLSPSERKPDNTSIPELKVGMTLEQADAAMGYPGVPISDDLAGTIVYEWIIPIDADVSPEGRYDIRPLLANTTASVRNGKIISVYRK